MAIGPINGFKSNRSVYTIPNLDFTNLHEEEDHPFINVKNGKICDEDHLRPDICVVWLYFVVKSS